jgi:predicted anti-sigma-YlaC factor YlaD
MPNTESPMSCQEVIARLDDDLADELRGAERVRVRMHLLGCRDCRVWRATYARTARLGRAALLAGPPPPVPEDLVAAVLRALADS